MNNDLKHAFVIYDYDEEEGYVYFNEKIAKHELEQRLAWGHNCKLFNYIDKSKFDDVKFNYDRLYCEVSLLERIIEQERSVAHDNVWNKALLEALNTLRTSSLIDPLSVKIVTTLIKPIFRNNND